MKLSQVKHALQGIRTIGFKLPDGTLVPAHFHVTEIGKVNKHFIDCGGNIRKEEVINFQLWNANDYNHRLHPEKLLKIVNLSEQKLGLADLDIEVEYQGQTIQKFGLDFDGTEFMLTPLHTDCLAKENCGLPAKKPEAIAAKKESVACCGSDSGCC